MKHNKLNETEDAKATLKKLMGPCYDNYIENHLAGDFAYSLCMILKRKVPNWQSIENTLTIVHKRDGTTPAMVHAGGGHFDVVSSTICGEDSFGSTTDDWREVTCETCLANRMKL